jgi:hypothetical protein
VTLYRERGDGQTILLVQELRDDRGGEAVPIVKSLLKLCQFLATPFGLQPLQQDAHRAPRLVVLFLLLL